MQCFLIENSTLFFCESLDALHSNLKYYKIEDLHNIVEISYLDFVKYKYRNAYLYVEDSSFIRAFRANDHILTNYFQENIIREYDVEGNFVQEYINIGFDYIYSMTVDKNDKLWIAQPTTHFIGQYSLNDEKELYKLGGDYEHINPGIFNYPEHIIAIEDYIYISDMGNNRICKLNINTKKLSEHLKFNEPTWEYCIFKNNEIVRLQSGLYYL